MKPQFKSKIKAGLLALCFWRKPEPDFEDIWSTYSWARGKKKLKDMEPSTRFRLKMLCRFFQSYEINFEENQGTCAFIERACLLSKISVQETFKVAELYRIIANPCSASFGFRDIPQEIFILHQKRIRQFRVRFFASEVLRLTQADGRNPE